MTTPRILQLHLETTGDARFDAVLGGGIPGQSVVVIAGEPGTGKTVLTLQLLFHAARQGKTCLYVTTLSEPAIKLIRYMQFFDFFDADVLDARIVLADLGQAVRAGAAKTLSELTRLVHEHEPNLIAIDSFKSIAEMLPDPRTARSFVYELATQTATWGATTLLLGEYAAGDMARSPEFAVADGIVHLSSQKRDLTSLRELEILKLRGMGYVSGKHFFEIDQRGFFVFPRVQSPESAPVTDDAGHPARRMSTGIDGLDRLLRGGIPEGSNTVIEGPTGSGKTLLGLQFLMDGARRGEKGVLFTLEETPDQLRTAAGSLGWDLASYERKERIILSYQSPVELSTDRYLQSARDLVERTGCRRAVLDSLTSLSLGVPSERRFKELVYAVGKYMRASGVTLMMTLESAQLLGADELSGHGVSFIADNVVRLRYLKAGGRLARGISVLKSRGIAHETDMRPVQVGAGGLTVGGRKGGKK